MLARPQDSGCGAAESSLVPPKNQESKPVLRPASAKLQKKQHWILVFFGCAKEFGLLKFLALSITAELQVAVVGPATAESNCRSSGLLWQTCLLGDFIARSS